jgi:hypothetical protein
MNRKTMKLFAPAYPAKEGFESVDDLGRINDTF